MIAAVRRRAGAVPAAAAKRTRQVDRALARRIEKLRPLLLRLAGAEVTPLIPLPVRAGFPYRKRAGRREYVRVKLRQNADGSVEAFKHAQDGAGVITSLNETDGLAELAEDVTTVEPGATIGFLSYALLVG